MIGVLFNCCEPESITKALEEIRRDPHMHRHLHHQLMQPCSTQALEDGPPKIYLGAYANKLAPVDPKWTLESSEGAQAMRADLSPEQYWDDFVKLWRNGNAGAEVCDNSNRDVISGIVGVQLIGGCCGIGPSHISVLKRRLRENDG